jgi:hypothetical protein
MVVRSVRLQGINCYRHFPALRGIRAARGGTREEREGESNGSRAILTNGGDVTFDHVRLLSVDAVIGSARRFESPSTLE